MAETFACAACGHEHEGEAVTGVTECRACRKSHCRGCLDENGLCRECAESN